MTRDQIAEDLLQLVVRIGNELPARGIDPRTGMPASAREADSVREAEWAYVKGLASHSIMTLRDQLLLLPPTSTLDEVISRSGPSRRT